jgi:hypothetical protein
MTVKVKDELFMSVPKWGYDMMRDKIDKLESKDDANQTELREFVRLQKDGINTAVSYVFCTLLTVLGGIVISSDRTWPPFHIPAEYNRYIGVVIAFTAIIMAPVTHFFANILWYILKKAKNHFPDLFH